jgi:TPR repeat protein
VLEEQGDLAAAAATYRRADQLGHGAAACNLGVLLVEQGDHAGAGECFRRADQRGEPAGAFNLAVVLEEEGDPIEALRAYERAALGGDPLTAERARSAMHDLRRRIERSSALKGGDPDDS